MEDYETTFENFWKEIVCNPDGTLNVDQVKRELHDYHMVMGIATEVYMHITDGKISKPNTLADEVINEADAHIDELHEELCKECEYFPYYMEDSQATVSI